MSIFKLASFTLASLAPLLLLAAAPAQAQGSSGLLTTPSAHKAAATMDRFETAVRGAGMKVFTRIDHAAAAKEAGLDMPPATVIVFGAPKGGTPNFIKAPTLAIDLPLKALIWEDAAGKVFVTVNSGEYIGATIFPRHGLPAAADGGEAQQKMLTGLVAEATR